MQWFLDFVILFVGDLRCLFNSAWLRKIRYGYGMEGTRFINKDFRDTEIRYVNYFPSRIV